MSHLCRDERLLAIKLAGTAERRAVEAATIHQIARAVDYDWLATALSRGRLLPLLGTRLMTAAPDCVPDRFRQALHAALVEARRYSTVVEQLALRAVQRLESAGIRGITLKGPHLAERLHGDIGMRISNDIDLLVEPRDFHDAVRVLGRDGYRSGGYAHWISDLPLFEASLRHTDDWRPAIDLHWRLHCSEVAFSREFLLESRLHAGGTRVPRPLDELAALLLFWSRDGLAGLRHAVDVAAWWDRYGADLGPGALDGLVDLHPQLRRPFTAAVLLAERTVGVPADRLFSDPDRHDVRTRLALQVANLTEQSSAAEFEASAIAVDGLLQPRGELAAFVQRHFLLPSAVIAHVYDLPQPASWASRELRRVHYAVRRGLRLAPAAAALALAEARSGLSRGPREHVAMR